MSILEAPEITRLRSQVDALTWLLAELSWKHEMLLHLHECHWHWQDDGVDGTTGPAVHGPR